MRVILASCGDFGVPTLEALAPGLVLVVSGPDRRSGRGLKNRPTPVAKAAAARKLPLLVTGDINHPDTLSAMAARAPDILVVADFGQILKPGARAVGRRAAINIHPSLLPRYRGAAPVERALLNRESVTGVTIISLVGRMDAGPILMQEKIAIMEDEDAPALRNRLALRGAALAVEALARIEAGSEVLTPQDESRATFAPMVRKEEGRLDWRKDAGRLAAEIRAFAGWPRSFTCLDGPDRRPRRLIIIAARSDALPRPAAAGPGTVIEAGPSGILIACGRGALRVTRLQEAGRRPVGAAEFVSGHPFIAEQVLE